MMQSTATYMPGDTGRPILRVDASGGASLTGGTQNWQNGIVNGHQLVAGETVPIKPGDSVQIKLDIGDRYPEWETRNIIWSKAPDGTPILGTAALKANLIQDFDARAGGNAN
jgi:hypothetical protein